MGTLLVLGGTCAGYVNAIAGGGSALTIPLLMICGVDVAAANGTNRIAVGIQAVAAAASFHQQNVRPWRPARVIELRARRRCSGRRSAPACSQYSRLDLSWVGVIGRGGRLLQPPDDRNSYSSGVQALGLLGIGLCRYFSSRRRDSLMLALINSWVWMLFKPTVPRPSLSPSTRRPFVVFSWAGQVVVLRTFGGCGRRFRQLVGDSNVIEKVPFGQRRGGCGFGVGWGQRIMDCPAENSGKIPSAIVWKNTGPRA